MKKLLIIILSILFVQLLSAQRTISGKVVDDSNGEPLIGVNILTNTGTGTITDYDGTFSLDVGADVGQLEFSYTGYTSQTITLEDGVDKLDVSLLIGELIEEIVVTGYAVERKKDLLGAVGVLKLDEIANVSNPNVLQSTQGRVAGVSVDVAGDPGQGTQVRIRGVSSLGNNDPLYIIDGVPIQSFQTDEIGSSDVQTWGLSWLNPNDIESIQVLKDAASSSIYGSRASNGVVIITTKQAKKKGSRVSINTRTTVESWNDFDDLTNNRERAILEWQGAVNDGSDPNATGIYEYEWRFDPSLGPGIQGQGVPVLDRIIYPDWLDESDQLRPSGSASSIHGGNIEEGTNWWNEIAQTGITQNYDVSFSQGSEKGGIYLGANYLDQEGVVIQTGYRRYGLRLNSNYSFLDNRVTIGQNLSLSRGERQFLDSGFGGTPDQGPYRIKSIIPVRTEDGRFAGPPGGGFSDRDNPVALAFDNRDDIINNIKIFGNFYVNVNILDDLSFKSSFGVDHDNISTRDIFRTYSRGFLANTTAELLQRQSNLTNWIWNNTLTYTKEFGDSRLVVFGGTEAVKNNVSVFSAGARDFAFETVEYFQLDAAAGQRTSSGSRTGFSLFSYFGKASYTISDKYLLSATVRRDGSSRFGLNNRFAVFPAFSAGWRLSEESFLKDNNLVSNLKIRVGWGRTGNQAILNDARFSLFQAIYAPETVILPWGGGCAQTVCDNGATSYDIGNNDGGVLPSGFLATQTGNDNLRWETTAEINFGVDFGIKNDLITGSFDVFNKKTEDILIQPSTIGAFGDGARQFVNGADMETKGWELGLQYNSPIKNDFFYTIRANFSSFNATITDLPETLFASFPGNSEQNIIGHAPNALFGYRTDGIFQSQAEVEAHAEQIGARVGALRYVDLNNDGTIDALDQEYGDANGVADVELGLNFQVNYKNFDFSLFAWGALGRKVTPAVFRTELGTLNNGENGGVNQLDAWSFTNTDTHIPAVSNSLQPFGFSLDYDVRNGNFLSFRQATIGYTLPVEKIAGNSIFSSLRFYLTGENLGWIVDRNGPNQYPQTGWSIEGNVAPSSDANSFGNYPKALRFSFGVNASF